jgi:hypothetical protein
MTHPAVIEIYAFEAYEGYISPIFEGENAVDLIKKRCGVGDTKSLYIFLDGLDAAITHQAISRQNA